MAVTLDSLLTSYGTVTAGDFVRTTGGIRIARYKFRLRPRQIKILSTTLTYNGYALDIRRNDDIRCCTHCDRSGHTTGRCRSRLVANNSMHVNSINWKLTPWTSGKRQNMRTSPPSLETARIEREPASIHRPEQLLQELADKEASVDWLRERYAEMGSSVAQRYNISETTLTVSSLSTDGRRCRSRTTRRCRDGSCRACRYHRHDG